MSNGSVVSSPAANAPPRRPCRNSRGDCRLSRSRGGTCRRWGCPGTARCRPVAHSSLRPHRLGAGERCPVAQHERGPLRAALPSTIPPCSSLTKQDPNSGPLHLLCLPLVVPHGFLPARASLTPECVHTPHLGQLVPHLRPLVPSWSKRCGFQLSLCPSQPHGGATVATPSAFCLLGLCFGCSFTMVLPPLGFQFFNLEVSEMTKMFDSMLSDTVATSHTDFWALDMWMM